MKMSKLFCCTASLRPVSWWPKEDRTGIPCPLAFSTDSFPNYGKKCSKCVKDKSHDGCVSLVGFILLLGLERDVCVFGI